VRVSLGIRLRTGDVCPQSGIWRVVTEAASDTPIHQGQAMPDHGGRSVIWELVQAF
jgi:hypothetical protein